MNTAAFPNETPWSQMVCHLQDTATDTEIIAVKHLAVNYRTVEALRDINLSVKPGRLTGIIGPNGAGKSTLIKAMLGLIPADRGTVTCRSDRKLTGTIPPPFGMW
jgi:manganese/iron transport system ATP-binding protein